MRTLLSLPIVGAQAGRSDLEAILLGFRDSIGSLFTSVGTDDVYNDVANGEITILRQSTAPTGLNFSTDVGTLWDDDDGNRWWWSGVNWVAFVINQRPIFPGSATLAAYDLHAREVLNESEIRLYSRATAPSSPLDASIWRDTSAGNAIKYYNGTTWITFTDANIIADANAMLDAADLVSDGYTRIFYRIGEPTIVGNIRQGSRWYDRGDWYKLHVADSSGEFVLGEADRVFLDTDLIKVGRGLMNITGANTLNTQAVTFATPFPDTGPIPTVIVVPRDTTHATAMIRMTVEDATVTRAGFVLQCVRTTDNNTNYQYVAFAV